VYFFTVFGHKEKKTEFSTKKSTKYAIPTLQYYKSFYYRFLDPYPCRAGTSPSYVLPLGVFGVLIWVGLSVLDLALQNGTPGSAYAEKSVLQQTSRSSGGKIIRTAVDAAAHTKHSRHCKMHCFITSSKKSSVPGHFFRLCVRGQAKLASM